MSRRPHGRQTSPAPRRTDVLNRDEILSAAVELIERDGVEALSMRKLAAAVDVEAMSLYNHVANKDDVLDGVTGLFFSRIELPAASGDWRADMRSLAEAARSAAHKTPRVATLALSREAVSDAGMVMTSVALTLFEQAGFGLDDSVRLVRTMTGFLTGSLLRELGIGQAGQGPRRAQRLRDSGIPIIARAADALSVFDFDEEYEYGLELMLLAIEHELGR
ncbi:TetR/AcrR family transcriptional regulator C-terminal domain-containing protein [Nocardia gamkensis]|uniref:TetR/AcrR family transcriptional regulator C-terminal domain-containing protein n=1 Tax=Nocardia gamkensis TaxID=352869 RepID=UPI0033C835BD